MRYEICNTLEATKACADVLHENWMESGQPKTDRFILDTPIYEYLADTDSFAILARDGEAVVGYVVVFMTRSPHTSRIIASNDTIYVKPAYRPRGLGGRLFYMAEVEAQKRGATRFQWACDVGSPLHRALVKRPHTMQQIVIEREL